MFIETSLINSKDVTSFQSYSKVFIAFLIVFMSLYYILQQIKREQKIVHRNLVFAIITYFSLELIFLLPLNFLINYKSELVFYIWLLRLSSNLLFYSYLNTLLLLLNHKFNSKYVNYYFNFNIFYI